MPAFVFIAALLTLVWLPQSNEVETLKKTFEAHGYSAIPVGKWSPDYGDNATAKTDKNSLVVSYPNNEISLYPEMNSSGLHTFSFKGEVTSMVFKLNTTDSWKPDCKVIIFKYDSHKAMENDIMEVKKLNSFIYSSSDGLKQPNFIVTHGNYAFIAQCRAVAFEDKAKKVMGEVVQTLSQQGK